MSAVAEKPKSGTAPDYTEDPSAYLLHHGWKPLGPAKSALTKWLDPTKPWPDGEWSEIEVFAKDQDGNLAPMTTKNYKGQTVQVKQQCWSPPAELMILERAVETQVERDMRKDIQRARDERVLRQGK